jgi:predicted DNA-binding transcriptional regulator AlpA
MRSRKPARRDERLAPAPSADTVAAGADSALPEIDLPTTLRIDEVCKVTQLCKVSVYSLIRRGVFPRPFHPSPNRSVWLGKEVAAFIASRVAARDQRAA